MKSIKGRIAVALVALICLFATISNSEGEAWDCPECGRKGNTGKFCGSCGEPAPSSESDSIYTPQPDELNRPSGFGHTIDSVDFLEKADADAQVIKRLNKYTLCNVIDTSISGGTTWYQVVYDGKNGYIDGMYFKQLTISELNRFLGSAEYNEGIRGNAETPAPILKEVFFPGEIITFGHYEQDNNLNNGQEAIEWIILDYDSAEKKALLLSRFGLDARPYHNENVITTWENCSLRSWLNGNFLKTAFSAEEQEKLLKTNVDNGRSQGYGGWNVKGEKITTDLVFLLSYWETFNAYFKDNHSRICKPTAYAMAQGSNSSGNGSCRWWLRSPGRSRRSAASVSVGGSRSERNEDDTSVCVRPAFWVKLDSGSI